MKYCEEVPNTPSLWAEPQAANSSNPLYIVSSQIFHTYLLPVNVSQLTMYGAVLGFQFAFKLMVTFLQWMICCSAHVFAPSMHILSYLMPNFSSLSDDSHPCSCGTGVQNLLCKAPLIFVLSPTLPSFVPRVWLDPVWVATYARASGSWDPIPLFLKQFFHTEAKQISSDSVEKTKFCLQPITLTIPILWILVDLLI